MLPLVIQFQKNSASNAKMGKTEQPHHGLANWGGWGRWCDSFNLVLLARVCVFVFASAWFSLLQALTRRTDKLPWPASMRSARFYVCLVRLRKNVFKLSRHSGVWHSFGALSLVTLLPGTNGHTS